MTRSVQSRRFPSPAQQARLSLRYAVQDYGLDTIEEGNDILKVLAPLSDARHYRVNSPQPYFGGWAEFCGLADGFFVSFGEMEFDTPQSAQVTFPDMLQVFIASNGDGEYVFRQGDLLSFEAPNAALIIEPPGEPPIDVTYAGYSRSIQVFIHREALKTLFSGGEHELPEEIEDFLAGRLRRRFARALPLGGPLLRCLEDVLTSPLEGRLRRVFLQSKALEIVCQAVEALQLRDGSAASDATTLTARGVLKAQRLLAETFISPPSLEALAHEAGLSRSALCSGFRQILGQSVFDYVQRLRMEHALTLLNDPDATITQVAHAVGYNHSSSFSVAVQRHFGASPTELRRRSAPTAPRLADQLADQITASTQSADRG